MKYIELTSYLKGIKYLDQDTAPKNKSEIATDEEFNKFVEIISINSRYLYMIKMSESAKSFFNATKDIASLFPKNIHDDLFYSVKNEFRYNGVPAKLIYLLLKAKSVYKYPNLAVSRIKREELLKFCYEDSLKGDTTIHDVICQIWNGSIPLLTSRRRKALIGNVYECYVEKSFSGEEFDQVALIHEKIANEIEDNNSWKDLVFSEESGLMIGSEILRYYNGHYGIVKDDLDLSKVT